MTTQTKNDASELANATKGGDKQRQTQPIADAVPETREPAQEREWEKGEIPETDGVLGRTKDRRRLMTALALAQGEVLNAKKSSRNDHFKTSYADLAEIADACRAALSRHLIAWVQVPIITETTEAWLETVLTHGPSGQYITGRLPIPKTNNSQDLAAAITYRRRIALASMVGVVSESEDDDGEAVREAEARAGTDGQPQEQVKTQNQRKAEEWADWAVRKVGTFKAVEDLVAFQEKHQNDLAGIAKLDPAGHTKLKEAMDQADQRLKAAEAGAGG